MFKLEFHCLAIVGTIATQHSRRSAWLFPQSDLPQCPSKTNVSGSMGTKQKRTKWTEECFPRATVQMVLRQRGSVQRAEKGIRSERHARKAHTLEMRRRKQRTQRQSKESFNNTCRNTQLNRKPVLSDSKTYNQERRRQRTDLRADGGKVPAVAASSYHSSRGH